MLNDQSLNQFTKGRGGTNLLDCMYKGLKFRCGDYGIGLFRQPRLRVWAGELNHCQNDNVPTIVTSVLRVTFRPIHVIPRIYNKHDKQ